MQVNVRPFRPSDNLDVATIEGHEWSSKQYWRDIAPGEEYADIPDIGRDKEFLVAELEGDVVGYVLAFRVDDEKHPFPSDEEFQRQDIEKTLYIDELEVGPGAQYQRAAGELLEELMQRSSEYDKLLLRTNPKEKKAMGLYLKYGFQDLDVEDPEHSERTYLLRDR
ncbi:MAG: GNAT family N-acetyltransferase [Candidatus Nanohaloarchaea archaeon]